MSGFRTVAQLEDVAEGGVKGVMIDSTAIVLVNVDGTIYALEDRCSHEEFPLSNGDVVAGEIECQLHGARFCVKDGTPRALPAVMPVKTYPVRVEGSAIQVDLG